MTSIKDVPLPWTFVANSWQYTTIYDGSGEAICRLDLEDWGVNEENQYYLEQRQEMVARLIVEAVNRSGGIDALPPKRDRSRFDEDQIKLVMDEQAAGAARQAKASGTHS